MGGFIKGDVVVLNFPFSDFSGAKRRPAIVVSALDGDDVILCQITTRSKMDKYSIKLEQEDFAEGKLSVDSIVRPNKIFTADKNIILYTACKISSAKLDMVTKAVSEIISG